MSYKTIGAIILAIIIGTLFFVSCHYALFDSELAKKQNEINILRLELQKVELQKKIKQATETRLMIDEKGNLKEAE